MGSQGGNSKVAVFAFALAAAWLAVEARWLGGWLYHVPLEADLRTTAGQGGPASRLLGPVLGADPVPWRLATALLVALVAARLGSLLARISGATAATWLLPVLVVIHPWALLTTRDIQVSESAVWCVGGALVVERLGRWSPRALLVILGCVATSLVVTHLDSIPQWPSMIGALCAPVGDPEAGTPWQRQASYTVPMIFLLALGHRRRKEGDERPMLAGFLILMAGLGGVPLLRVLGLGWVLAFAAARAWDHRTDRIVVIFAVALMTLSGHNSARLQDRLEAPRRSAVETLLTRLRALPAPKGVSLTDVVIGRPVLGDALPLAFPERDVRAAIDLVDPGEGRQLRVSLYGESREGWTLQPLIRATRVSPARISLLEPEDNARLDTDRPQDEPTFVWKVAPEDDPRDGGFSFLYAGQPADTAGRVVRRVDLSSEQLQRSVQQDGQIRYGWRPSIRGDHRELLWERGDLTRSGTSLTWTVVARPRGRLHGFLMPAPRRVHAAHSTR